MAYQHHISEQAAAVIAAFNATSAKAFVEAYQCAVTLLHRLPPRQALGALKDATARAKAAGDQAAYSMFDDCEPVLHSILVIDVASRMEELTSEQAEQLATAQDIVAICQAASAYCETHGIRFDDEPNANNADDIAIGMRAFNEALANDEITVERNKRAIGFTAAWRD